MAGRKQTKNASAQRGAIAFLAVAAALVCILVALLMQLKCGGTAPAPQTTAVAPTLTATPAPSAAPTPAPEPTFSPRRATIRAAGDLMMHEDQLEAARRPGEGYDFTSQYALVRDSLSDADYTLANLETTVGLYSDKPYSGYPRFNAPPEMLEAVRGAGIDFVSLANNHILDRYFDGMLITVANVREAGLDYSGVYVSAEDSLEPDIFEINGIRVGFLCYTYSTNDMEKHSDARAVQFGVRYLYDRDYAADVRALRQAGAEVVIAMPHWGAEFRRTASSTQVSIAMQLAQTGVDVVLGGHPHVVQQAGMMDTPDGEKTLVAFSLGNFNSDMDEDYADTGIIFEFTLVEREEGGFDVVDPGYVPVFCWRQDGLTRTIPSLPYYDQPPEGMSPEQHARLRAGVESVDALMGPEMARLER